MVSLLRIPFIVSLKKLAASEHLACVLVLGFFGFWFGFFLVVQLAQKSQRIFDREQ